MDVSYARTHNGWCRQVDYQAMESHTTIVGSFGYVEEGGNKVHACSIPFKTV